MHAGALDYAMHNYAQLCTIMHDNAGCIATKTHRDCKQEGTWDCDPPQTDSTVKSAAAIHAYFGQKITLLSLLFRRWKNFIVRQNIFSSGSMCRCILLDKIVHDKHNNKLHWTRVEQTIMHNYAQLCTVMQFGPIVNYAKLCTIMHVHNPPPPCTYCCSNKRVVLGLPAPEASDAVRAKDLFGGHSPMLTPEMLHGATGSRMARGQHSTTPRAGKGGP